MNDMKKELTTVIKRVMKGKGVSQTDIAIERNVSRQHISTIVNGNKVSICKMLAFLHDLGYTVELKLVKLDSGGKD